MTPIADRPGSAYAAGTWGGGFIDWGAGMGFAFREVGGVPVEYDASEYEGISFWARTDEEFANVWRVNVPDVSTSPEGGWCGDDCGDHFGRTFVVTTQWRQYSFSWASLRQTGWGPAPPGGISPAQLYGVELLFAAQGVDFVLYVDDITFYR